MQAEYVEGNHFRSVWLQVMVDIRPVTKSYKPEEERLSFLVRNQRAIWTLLTTFAKGQGVQLRYNSQASAVRIQQHLLPLKDVLQCFGLRCHPCAM